jgi:hypothetical protein
MMIFIALTSCDRQQGPKWVKIRQDASASVFVDKNYKVSDEKGVLRSWLKVEYTEEGRAEQQAQRETFYILSTIEVRCQYKDFRFISYKSYDQRNQVITGNTTPNGWIPSSSGPTEAICRELCK